MATPDDEEQPISDYSNVHRAFLQAFLARQTLTLEEAKPILAAIETAATPNRPTLPEDVSQEDLTNYIETLNTAISPFDLEIRSARHQQTRERIWALVNTTSDALTQMSTLFTAEEVGFIRRVLDAMFETYNTRRAEIMAVTSMQALKLCKPVSGDSRRRDSGNDNTQGQPTVVKDNGVTMAQAERVLELLADQGWFELSQRGYYSLSPRSLLELRGWLVEMYNGEDEGSDKSDEDDDHRPRIKFCAACRDIVTVGQRCPNLDCEARVHNHCVSNLFRAQGGRKQCPKCERDWVHLPHVGEKAARSNGASNRRTTNGTTIAGPSRRGAGRATQNGIDEEDETNEGMEDDD